MTEFPLPLVKKPLPANGENAAITKAALDLEGIYEIGLDAWRESYQWPVSDREFDTLANAAWDEFLAIGADMAEQDRDLWFSDIRIVGFVLQHLHLSAAALRFTQAGKQVTHGTIVEPNLYPNWNSLSTSSGGRFSAGTEKQGILKALGKTWLLNRAAPLNARLGALAGRTSTWALGSRTPLRAAYLKEHRIACRFVTLADICPAPRPQALSASTLQAVDRQLQSMAAAAKSVLGLEFKTDKAGAAWAGRLAWLAGVATQVQKVPRLPATLLLTDLSSAGHRIAARTMHRRGTKVVGFHHGNSVGAQPHPSADFVEFLAIDRFVVPNAGSLNWRKQVYASGKVAPVHPVEFERVKTGIYREWLAKGNQASLPKRVSKVMIVGYPPNWIRYAHLLGHWSLAQLDLEVALVKHLAGAGFTLLYKAHPEWEDRMKRIFSDLPCQFVGGHLEDCWPIADAFVFPRITSTSFGFALCTNRPIALLDMKGQQWIPEAYELLSRRCHMIPACVGDDLRITFDNKALISSLEAPIREPDQTFVLEAMCK